MARSELSKAEKEKVKAIIEQTIGQTRPVSAARKDWRVTPDERLSIFITFSRSDQLFYDIDPKDLHHWLAYPRAFTVFVMGVHSHALIIPVQLLRQLIENLSPKGYGEIKFHIVDNHNKYRFLEVPEVDLSKFYNNYAQLNTDVTVIETMVNSDLESIALEEEYFEGKKGQRLTNYYERNLRLRTAAILAHGTKCMACDFDFEKVYGKHGSGFIEVHHVCRVSSLTEEVAIDPVTDMAVVCSNCHRMIHRHRNEVLSLDAIRGILQNNQGNRAQLGTG